MVSEKIKCSNCGEEITSEDSFCNSCGMKTVKSKREYKMESEPKDNFVVIVLNIVGFLFLIIAAVSFFSTGGGELSGLSGVIIFGGSAIPFFFFAQVLDNLIVQTFYLKNIYKNTLKEEAEIKG